MLTLLSATAAIIAPPNDNFADRILLTGTNISVSGTNYLATKEPGEPNHAGSTKSGSIWWSWTAPEDGRVVIDFPGGPVEIVLAVYTGSKVDGLQVVSEASFRDYDVKRQILFFVKAGVAYQIAFDDHPTGYPGKKAFRLQFFPTPVNDRFANRIQLAGTNFAFSANNIAATYEPGELSVPGSPGHQSLWWSWTAPRDGWFSFKATGQIFETVVAAYTGSTITNLTLVGLADSKADVNYPRSSALAFAVVRGATYQIMLDSLGSDSGPIDVQALFGSAAENDDFANRRVLTGNDLSTGGFNTEATREAGEPVHSGAAGGHSLWWSWTAPATGRLTINTFGSSVRALAAVYTGTALSNLVSVVNGSPYSSFRVEAGQTYQIAVEDESGPTGFISWRLNFGPIPDNDDFALRFIMSGTGFTASVTNTYATREPGEPSHAGTDAYRSLWWSWTAPKNGVISIETTGSSAQAAGGPVGTVLAVYTGSSLNTLTPVIDNGGPSYPFHAITYLLVEAGVTYQIAVDCRFDATLLVGLNYLSGLANDLFSGRTVLTGTHLDISADNQEATKEPGEPSHANLPPAKSLWWSWTAPQNGTLLLDTAGSTYSTRLTAYTGTNLGGLIPVASDAEKLRYSGTYAYWQSARVNFPVIAKTTYQIAVDGLDGASGSTKLQLRFGAAPVNDNFANRIVLFGTNVALNADNTFATLEPGEATLSSNLDSKTLWWSWTASQNGSVQLKARNLECRLTVFTGLTFTSLNLVASATANSFYLGNQMYFLAQAGTTYQIAVDGFNGASGLIDFSLKFNVSPYVFSIPYLSLAKGASNTMQLNLLADPGQRVRLEGSSDLLRWNTNGVVIGPTTITLSNTNQAKFMRAVVE